MATITFTYENRKITSGEFGASFGAGDLILEVIKEWLPLSKTMSAEWGETSATITYNNKLGKKAHEAIWYLSQKGIITNLSY